ncbi:MAG: restriction endonuclease subunit S [Gammaproteobacteria bacterium]|nr:restriction endonuclease subunit S [Gammaproteobacteria bacterium]
MSVENNIPEIRFKGFNGAWEFQTIEKLIKDEILLPPKDGNHGNIHPKSTDFVDFGIPFIMANNIKEGKIELYNCSHISKEQADSLQKGFAKEGDVLLTHKGTVGEVAIVLKNKFSYLMLTPQVTYYRVLKNKVLDHKFLATSFVTGSFQYTLKEVSGGGTRAYIGITEQQELGISIPPKATEQTKIGNYFQQLDTLISQHQQKHDKLLNLKKSLLEKMFPKQGKDEPEIRFKGFSGAWEERGLGEVCEITTGKLDANAMNKDGKYDFYTSGVQKYRIDYPAFEGPAITIAGNGATVGYMHLANGKFNAYQRTYVLTKFVANRIFIYFMVGNVLPIKINQEVRAGNIPYIVLDMLTDLKILMPSKSEQTKIGNLFKNLDTLLSQHQSQLKKLKQIKQACLAKMFV